MTPPDVNSLLGGRSADEFLRACWQKKPLLIRNAWPGLEALISPEELAGLACEEEVHARLVEYTTTAPHWQVSYSPFAEKDFLSLPEKNWTLLVSDCEKLLPELTTLIQPFRFIPDWRIDDLMISYAADQGSVGPHIDQYDVFLLQLSGKREWQIENQHRSEADCIENIELAILKDFNPEQKWTLSPGDMLYLPPGIPHHGIAQGNCLTASIGFRAPSAADCVRDYADFVTGQLPLENRFQDPDLKTQTSSAEISRDSIAEFRQLLQESLSFEDDLLTEWLGKMLTTASATDSTEDFNEPEKDMIWQRNPDARMAFIRQDSCLLFFVNGNMFTLPLELEKNIRIVCEQPQFRIADLPLQTDKPWNEVIDTCIRRRTIIPYEE